MCWCLSKNEMKVERTLSMGHVGWVANLDFSSDMALVVCRWIQFVLGLSRWCWASCRSWFNSSKSVDPIEEEVKKRCDLCDW